MSDGIVGKSAIYSKGGFRINGFQLTRLAYCFYVDLNMYGMSCIYPITKVGDFPLISHLLMFLVTFGVNFRVCSIFSAFCPTLLGAIH